MKGKIMFALVLAAGMALADGAAGTSSTTGAPATGAATSGGRAGLEFVQLIKDGVDGVSIKNHVGAVTARSDYVYASIVYSGQLKYFRRDPQTGKLSYVDELAFEDKAMSMGALVWANGRLYFNGGSGHWTGDQDSRGLHWLDVDAKTGKPAEKGSIKIPISAGLLAGADEKNLYLLASGARKIIRYQLAAAGTPAAADEVALKDAKGGLSRLTLSPDGKRLYVLFGEATFGVACVQLKPDGSMEYQGVSSLAKMTEGLEPDGKFGWGWGKDLFMSPDGLHGYAAFCKYGGKDFRLALYKPDAKGEWAFVERLDEKTGPNMVRMEAVAFEPDGATGYFASGTECSGNAAGWFTRDPKTGQLTFGGVVKETKGTGPDSMFLDAQNGYVYVGTWKSQQLFVLRTAKAGGRGTGK